MSCGNKDAVRKKNTQVYGFTVQPTDTIEVIQFIFPYMSLPGKQEESGVSPKLVTDWLPAAQLIDLIFTTLFRESLEMLIFFPRIICHILKCFFVRHLWVLLCWLIHSFSACLSHWESRQIQNIMQSDSITQLNNAIGLGLQHLKTTEPKKNKDMTMQKISKDNFYWSYNMH